MMGAQSRHFWDVRAHLQQLGWKPHGQSEGELMARKYQWCIPVSLRSRGAAQRSGVPARTSVDDSDRVEAVCCVFDWRTSRNNECVGIPSVGGAVENGAEILRRSGSWCAVCCVMGVVLTSEGNLGIVDGDNPVVGDGHAMRVARQIAQDVARAPSRHSLIDGSRSAFIRRVLTPRV